MENVRTRTFRAARGICRGCPHGREEAFVAGSRRRAALRVRPPADDRVRKTITATSSLRMCRADRADVRRGTDCGATPLGGVSPPSSHRTCSVRPAATLRTGRGRDGRPPGRRAPTSISRMHEGWCRRIEPFEDAFQSPPGRHSIVHCSTTLTRFRPAGDRAEHPPPHANAVRSRVVSTRCRTSRHRRRAAQPTPEAGTSI